MSQYFIYLLKTISVNFSCHASEKKFSRNIVGVLKALSIHSNGAFRSIADEID